MTEEPSGEAVGETPDDTKRGVLRADIVTLFPQMVREAASHSIVGRAQAARTLDLRVHDLRDWAEGRYRQADDYPFGGGAGMVLMPAPVFACLESVLADAPETPILLMAPDGERFDQRMARELAELPRFLLLCGHYEGVDERVREALVTRTVSIGDYVLTGGELPALVILDAVTRLLPGVLGNAASPEEESFGAADRGLLLEYPHYTRPAEFRGRGVPEVLLSGHHAKIAAWRRQQALVRTRERRPDLWERFLPLSKVDRKLLEAYDAERGNEASAGKPENKPEESPPSDE
ncbi:MAG: tRNA (guanosine(37)-N1)-methyltransferase TrmD [Capsulimonadales bacterium]|nr:tRNA (guanosine(37)-N1)-methyltransferase TrmD [Capsulimonadales bacterium]